MTKQILTLFLILSSVLVLSGCRQLNPYPSRQVAGDTEIAVRPIPAFKPALDEKGAPLMLDVSLESGSRRLLAADAKTNFSATRNQYMVPSHDSMLELIDWWGDFLKRMGIKYSPNGYDCDDYTRALILFSEWAAIRDGYNQGPILIAGGVFVLELPWQGVAPGGLHAVVVFRSEKGLFILEPQNGKIVPAEEFPMRRAQSIFLF